MFSSVNVALSKIIIVNIPLQKYVELASSLRMDSWTTKSYFPTEKNSGRPVWVTLMKSDVISIDSRQWVITDSNSLPDGKMNEQSIHVYQIG